MEELSELQEEEKKLEQELQSLEQTLKSLNQEEDQFWEKCNEYQLELDAFQHERDSINLKYDHDVRQYEKLQKTVVYNDAFCISHDGPFGTINGFRLGRLSTHPVSAHTCIYNSIKLILVLRSSGMKSMQRGVRRYCCCIL